MDRKNRVVVTGMGAITPIGNDVESFWRSLKEKKVGIGQISTFDTTDYKVKLAAEVKDFDAKEYMDVKASKRMERFSQFAVAAAKEALEDSDSLWKRKIHTVSACVWDLESEVFSLWRRNTRSFWKKDLEELTLCWSL